MVDDGGQQQDGEEVGDQRQSPGKLVAIKNSLGLTDLNTKQQNKRNPKPQIFSKKEEF